MGGRTPSRIDSRPTIADSEPAAAMRWPTIDFGELAGASSAAAPSAARIARVSTTSFALVPVPWAQMKSTSSGAVPVRSSASVMARAACSPEGSGALM